MSYRNWCFTIFDPIFTLANDESIQLTQEQKEILYEPIYKLNVEKCKYVIYGYELTKDNKPHLQGYIELNKCHRLVGVKKLLDPTNGKKSTIHVEPSSAGRELNRLYCSKGLQSHKEWENEGNKGPNYGKNARIYERTFKEVREGQGKRNDWVNLYNKIKETPNFADILEEHPEECIKYPNGIQKAIDTVKNSNNLNILKESLSDLKLYNWEVKLENELKEKPHNRKILWYVDTVGGGGKTTFAKYLLAQGNCTYFTNARCADIARSYNGEKIAIFDFTRSIEGRVNYSAVEQIKNGLIFSTKYDSNCKINTIPHVICLSNFHPDESALSADRWDIRYLNDIDKQVYLPEVPDSMNIDTSNDDSMNIHDLSTDNESYDNILISSEDELSLNDSINAYSTSSSNSENMHAPQGGAPDLGSADLKHAIDYLDLGNTDPTDKPRSETYWYVTPATTVLNQTLPMLLPIGSNILDI